MHVEEIDPRSAPDDLLVAIHEIEAACSLDQPFRPASLSLAYYRHWSDGVRRRFVARLDDEVAGGAVLMVPSPTFAYAEIFVQPDARRRGLGTALVDALKAAARQEGITAFFGHPGAGAGAGSPGPMGGVAAQRDVASE